MSGIWRQVISKGNPLADIVRRVAILSALQQQASGSLFTQLTHRYTPLSIVSKLKAKVL